VKRLLIPGIAIAMLMLAATALAASQHQTIKLAPTNDGRLLTNSSGRTVYVFTKDGRNKNRCGAVAGCESIWPPVITRGRPAAGPGVKASLLATITLSAIPARSRPTTSAHRSSAATGTASARVVAE
jgi:hypothetical protein